MRFRRTFAVTTWLWRKVSSRPARLFYLGIILIVGVPGIAFRVEAAFFARRVHKVIVGLSSLRIGITSKDEVLSRMKGLKVVERSRGNSDCGADECFSIHVSSPQFSDWALRRAGRTGNEALSSVLSWWGLRTGAFGGYVNLNSGKVSSLGYQLILSAPYAYYGVVINANSTISARHFAGSVHDVGDESPDYQVYHHWKSADQNTNVYFTRDAAPELLRHVFDLRLRCVWSLAGCLTANQLLPEAELDRLRIEHAADERMKGLNQCPDWILPGRARDMDDILLVEVKNSGPVFISAENTAEYRRANFRLLRVLKGKPRRPLDNVLVTPGFWVGKYIHNSAIDLLNPGQKLLLFSGPSPSIDEPCEAVAATESAVQTVETALRATTR